MANFHDSFFAHDWSGTPVGAAANWPPEMRRNIQFLLDTPHPMALVWGDRKSLIFNEAFAALLSDTWPEALGQPLDEIWAPIWDDLSPIINQAYRGQGCIAEAVPYKSWESGFEEVRYYTFSCTPIRGLEDDVSGVACLCTDSTDRVLAAAIHARERAALYALFDRAPGFVAITEGPDHKIAFSNKAYLKLTAGRARVGFNIGDAVPEVVPQGFITLLDRIYESGETYEASATPVLLRSATSGQLEQHYVTFLYEPIKDDSGSVTGLFLQGNVVTGEKLAQEKVEQLQDELIHLSRANAMNAMASTLAHELNQPLTAVSNYVSGVKRMLGQDPVSLQLAGPLQAISDNAHRAADIIRSVRGMVKKESVEHGTVQLRPLLREALKLAALGSTRSVTVALECPGDLLVRGDRIQIQQVIMNLVRNAREAAENEKAPRVHVVAAMKGSVWVEICVRDNGPGFDQPDLNLPFEAFRSTTPGGMGVGLSISRTIVEAHGGEIRLGNHERGGGMVCLTLPAVTDDQT